MAQYELLLIGSPTSAEMGTLGARMAEIAGEFGMVLPDDLAVRGVADAHLRDRSASTTALYFGGDPAADAVLLHELREARIPTVPVVRSGDVLANVLPATIQATNACFLDPADTQLDALASVCLESLGLLRRQRRVFVSYRRDEARTVAVQLHDELSGRGFDVFLDTHDIRPGEPFQEMLWHRLADCDVVIMLDTKDYFGSKWTKQELGRSLAQGIQVLRVIWPGHTPTRHLSLSDALQLTDADIGADKRLLLAKIEEIVGRTESVRSRSVASRHLHIAGSLRIEVERLGGKFGGIGAHRAMALTLPNGLEIQAYPVVGVPTAELLNDIQDKALAAGHGRFPCLVYDHVGIRDAWLKHLKWLDSKITEVRALKIYNAAWELAEWDS